MDDQVDLKKFNPSGEVDAMNSKLRDNTTTDEVMNIDKVDIQSEKDEVKRNDDEELRFTLELEFLQLLSNPQYILFLGQSGIMEKKEFQVR